MKSSLIEVRIEKEGRYILLSGAILTRAFFRFLIGFPSPGIPSSGRSGKFLRAPLPLSIHSLLSGLLLDFRQQVYDHVGHTSRRPLERNVMQF